MNELIDCREKYLEVMEEERKLAENSGFVVVEPEEAYGTVQRLVEVMGLSFVSRGYNKKYHVSNSNEKFETVAAHTNLATSLLMGFLRWRYASDTTRTADGFSFFSVIEAIKRHDLPENKTGDISDDGNRDEDEKIRVEQAYQCEYSKMAPYRDAKFEIEVLRLLKIMEQHGRPGTGRALYLSDKVSALLITLYLNEIGRPPYATVNTKGITRRDIDEMKIICRNNPSAKTKTRFLVSEMWAVDYFKSRKIINYDETGYFTSLIVMATLMMNGGKWYLWREQWYDFNKSLI